MRPDLELIQKVQYQSFRIWSHGYPHQVARWHYHPEYELHYLRETSGKMFVGDYIGDCEPGNLVFTGPNIPHNWVSELASGVSVAERDLVLQLGAEFMQDCMALFPEFGQVQNLLDDARFGVQFGKEAEGRAHEALSAMLGASDARRVILFLDLLDYLSRAPRVRLASPSYDPSIDQRRNAVINQVLAYILENYTSDLREADVAELAHMAGAAFSRFFRKSTGLTFIQYVNHLRLNRACELLMNSALSVTDICYRVGFNNVSHFNHQFLQKKQMSPSKFRACHLTQGSSGPGQTAVQ
ncbi:AraC family transcriptional regulator [Collimonas sp.]|jgi:AraC-like DNA-binding protein|uniref:AraC family transcriptional regulator n=1 Tax=Collimonas sp. TaxID=1963772 RepID=UPI002CBDE4FE|nr:AraC family transcriptional regulator [Collimonas sp.]HWX03887.1 AraC family transcriptional regulator [Collimonas sp.]